RRPARTDRGRTERADPAGGGPARLRREAVVHGRQRQGRRLHHRGEVRGLPGGRGPARGVGADGAGTETTRPPDPPSPAGPPSAPEPGRRRSWLREHSELCVCALLLVIGVLVLTDAVTMDVDLTQRGPVGPRTVPFVVGGGLLAVAALLAVDVLRGVRGRAEGGAA